MDLLSAFFLPRFRRLNGIMHWRFGRISPEKIRRSMCSSTSQMIVRVSLWNAFQIAYYSACVTEQINAQRTIAWIQNVLHLSRIFAFALAFVRFQNHFQENIRFDFLETHFFFALRLWVNAEHSRYFSTQHCFAHIDSLKIRHNSISFSFFFRVFDCFFSHEICPIRICRCFERTLVWTELYLNAFEIHFFHEILIDF